MTSIFRFLTHFYCESDDIIEIQKHKLLESIGIKFESNHFQQSKLKLILTFIIVGALILDRSLDGARWSPVRNRYVSDKNSVFDENHKFFSKFFFSKYFLQKSTHVTPTNFSLYIAYRKFVFPREFTLIIDILINALLAVLKVDSITHSYILSGRMCRLTDCSITINRW